jgi:hypothetical protein
MGRPIIHGDYGAWQYGDFGEDTTPSGGNYESTVTGGQDIYDDPGFYSLSDSGNEFDPSKYSLTGDGGYDSSGGYSGDAGMSVQKPYVDTDPSNDWWGDSGLSTYEENTAKMGKTPSVMTPTVGSGKGSFSSSGGTSSNGGGTSGRLRAQTGNQTLTEQRAYDKSLIDAQNAEWERRFALEQTRKSTSRPVAPTGEMPGTPDMPEFAAPTRDEDRVKALTQQKSAAGLRAMRAQIQKAMGQGYRNANVKRMTLRDALAGYGEGIENVMSGAQNQAESTYNTEYAKAYDTAGKNWQTEVNAKNQEWQNQINNYLRQYGSVTTNG